MLIATINHLSNDGVLALVSKINSGLEALAENNVTPDVLLGPDYSLVTHDAMSKKRPNTIAEREYVLKNIKRISKYFPQVTLLPGSMFWYKKNHDSEKSDETFMSVPVYRSGKLLTELFKERDNGESEKTKTYAKSIGRDAVYHRGDSRKNSLTIADQKIAVEICGDHGNQDVKGVNLELIMAYDNKGGFYVTTANNQWSRSAVVCNGFDGVSSAIYFDAKTQNFKSLSSKKYKELELFNILLSQ